MLSLDFQSNKPIVLIDASYYVFFRYFATMRWFAFQKQEFDMTTVTENEVFVKSFIRHMEADIKKISRKWKTTLNNIVFCSDCQRCDIWRNDIYKEYKGTRAQNANFNRRIFNIFNEYMEQKAIKKVSFDRLEADDIIYLLQKQIKSFSEIVIITNDSDYLQLVDKNITIINMQFKDITLRGSQDAKADLYNKAIYGDKSDNIQKIAPFITKDKSLEISRMSEADINAWLHENNLLQQFNFNMQLIAFENIPSKIASAFNDSISIRHSIF